MANSTDRSRPIETKDELVAVLEAGIKPAGDWLIGTEHEKFPFFSGDITPVPFEGDRGIEALLIGLLESDKGFEGIYEGERLVGLKQPTKCGKFSASVTLEPGGQVELSGAPLSDVHQTIAEIETHLTDLHEVAAPLEMEFLGLGYSPKFTLEETPRMPKGRYDIMRAYMPKVGTRGLNMMHNSCTVQVNLDFGSEADMVKKFRVGLALQPLATALFANSVFKDGKLNGFQSFRSEVWRDVDAARTGMLPFVFEDGMGFERYVSYALEVPMYFVYRNGRYIEGRGQPFSKFMAGKFEGLEGELPTLDDWEMHLTTLFPEVRLKQFLEMRGADCGPLPYLPALSAFWTGLFYDSSSLDAAYDLIKSWDAPMMQEVRDRVPTEGLATAVGKRDMQMIACEVLEMSAAGLKARARFGNSGSALSDVDERHYLEPLQDMADDGWTQARRLIDRFKSEWNEDINAVYRELAYR
jgi:glutamate--cysteine ligase